MAAIWKDYFCNLGTGANSYFRIRVGSTTIYQGRAYKRPGASNIYIRINDICADYMSQIPAPVPIGSGTNHTFPMSFTVQKSSTGSSWTTVETVSFTDDWSYDPSFDGSTNGMSFPITGRIDLRQKIVQTRYSSGTVTATARYGSTTRSISLSVITSSNNTAFENALANAGAGRVEFNCPSYATYSGKTLTSVTIGLSTYTVANTCPRYVLYFKTKYGGFDHLLIEGSATRKHSTARDIFIADYDNSVLGREEWDYMNEVTETYELNSGYMTVAESARMQFLLDSTQVFFCDLQNASAFYPAVVATDSYAFQNINRNGMQLRNHTFEVRIAQNKYIR